MGGYAWVTLATNDAYCLGVLVLAHSLRRVNTKHDLVCLITPGVTAKMRETLAAVFSLVQEVNVLDSKDEEKLALLARPELGITFTKLHCWRLTQYEKCVFVDADTLVVRNCDELFEREELSAAPDVGWPDCFNSGVFVFRPSQQTFASITAFAAAKGSFDGGDQGLLNMYFSDWATKDISKHLPFIYNMCSTATYSYLPAFKQFGEDVRIIHFIGITKPWLQYFDTLTGIVYPPPESMHLQPLLQLWFNIFYEKVHPHLSTSMTGIAGALAQMTLGQPRSAEQIAYEEHMRKQSWEQGQIDYMGRDSFDNIWKKICETLSLAPQRQPTPPKEDTAEDTAEKSAEPAEKIPVPIDVEVNKPAVEADKDPTQSLVCEIPKEISATQIPEQTTLSAEEKIKESAIEAVPTKESSEPISPATEDVCVKPTEESKDVKTDTQVLAQAPEPSAEPTPAETIAEQCKLAAPPTTQKTASQDESKSLPETKEPRQQDDSQADATCKKEAVAPVTQTDSAATLAEAKSETPTSSPQEATQSPADAPTNIVATSFVTSKEPSQDSAKRVSETTIDITQPLTIDPSEQHAEMLLAASEVSTVSPVPIQVAEAVLQAEPKESVSDTAAAASDQAIAATVTAVHRSADITPIETTGRVQLNGSACESERRSDVAVLPEKDLPEKADAPTEAEKKSTSTLVAAREAPPATEQKVESSSSTVVPEESSAKAEKLAEQTGKDETKETKQIEKTEAPKAKPTEQKSADVKPAEQIAKTETVAKAEVTEASPEQIEVEETAAKSPDTSEIPKSPITEQSPTAEESIKAKATSIPSTPTVIEATPPISPSAEEAEEKTAKKDLKKSDSADGADSEGADKKTAKKTVKKVTKKPKAKPEEATSSASESAASADSSPSKPKKTVKVTKKTSAKTGLTLETTATSVPETPPSPSPASTASPDAPVPPKRKTKSSTSSSKGTAGSKKPDAEE